MRVRAAVSRAPGAPLSVEELELTDSLLDTEVLVRVESAGVCHSDIEMRDLPSSSPLMPKPIVLGHEGAGIVEHVGAAVTELAPGDKVILGYHAACPCRACHGGLEPYCQRFFKHNLSGLRLDGSISMHDGSEPVRGSYHQQSSWATHAIATEASAVKVNTELPTELLGPLGCGFLTGYGAIRNAATPSPGSSFVLFGAGAVGLAGIVAAAAAGCDPIVAVDLHPSRLEMARRVGATHTVDAGNGNALPTLRSIMPRGFDYSLEATGVPSVMTEAIEVLGLSGRATLVGVVMDPDATVGIRPIDFMSNQIVHGIRMGHSDPHGTIRELVEHVEQGRLPLAELVTFYDLDDVNQAIDDSLAGRVFKAILRPSAGGAPDLRQL